MIRLSDDTLFVHPLPNHLKNHVTAKSGAKPHLVYRKSAKQIKCHSNKGTLLVSSKTKTQRYFKMYSIS